jgi:hypothetical protein
METRLDLERLSMNEGSGAQLTLSSIDFSFDRGITPPLSIIDSARIAEGQQDPSGVDSAHRLSIR